MLDLMISGHTNAQLADKLMIRPSTVKSYVSCIMSELGVENLTQAAVLTECHHLVS